MASNFDPKSLAAMNKTVRQRVRKKAANKTPTPEAYNNQQLDLFQTFLVNTPAERDALSNSIALWDNVPRYSISRIKQTELRNSKDGFPPILNLPFQYLGVELVAQIRPARIEIRDEQGVTTGKTIDCYPAAREELIEHALRKLATQQNLGYLDMGIFSCGVSFSLHQLRKELADRGHAMKYADLVAGLDVMNLANIRIIDPSSNTNDFDFDSQAYLPRLSKVSKRPKGDEVDPEARWLVQFHSALTRSIDQLTYRQFNYARLMRCRSQLSRWLLTQLVLKYTFASMTDPFKLLYSTVQRDSGLLSNYSEKRKGIDKLDAALDEIQEEGVLMGFERLVRSGVRGAIQDVEYTLRPTRQFVGEQKAANKRLAEAETRLQLVQSAQSA